MSKVEVAVAPITAILFLLNTLGAIISGIWLAIIGEWWALGIGLIALFRALD